MPAIQDPNLGLNYGWTLGEDNWNTGMDSNLKRLGALMHLSVIDRGVATPPASPTDGDRYIVGSGATGAWAGQDDNIAVRVSGTWEFYAPKTGWAAWVEDELQLYVKLPAGWATLSTSQPYDIHTTLNGRPDSSMTLARVVFARTTTFAAGLTESQAVAETAATAAASFPLTKNGSSIGSVDWAISATTATFTFASEVVFNAGDVLELIAPAVADVTLADLAFTLVGYR